MCQLCCARKGKSEGKPGPSRDGSVRTATYTASYGGYYNGCLVDCRAVGSVAKPQFSFDSYSSLLVISYGFKSTLQHHCFMSPL